MMMTSGSLIQKHLLPLCKSTPGSYHQLTTVNKKPSLSLFNNNYHKKAMNMILCKAVSTKKQSQQQVNADEEEEHGLNIADDVTQVFHFIYLLFIIINLFN